MDVTNVIDVVLTAIVGLVAYWAFREQKRATYLKAAVYPSLLLGVWSLVPLLPPWLFPQAADAYWRSEGVYAWPLLLLAAFAAGWVSTVLLKRRGPRDGVRISPRSGALVGLLTGLIATMLGTAIMTPVAVVVLHLLPGFPVEWRLNWSSWRPMLHGYGLSYIIPALVGGLLAGVWFHKRLASLDNAA